MVVLRPHLGGGLDSMALRIAPGGDGACKAGLWISGEPPAPVLGSSTADLLLGVVREVADLHSSVLPTIRGFDNGRAY